MKNIILLLAIISTTSFAQVPVTIKDYVPLLINPYGSETNYQLHKIDNDLNNINSTLEDIRNNEENAREEQRRKEYLDKISEQAKIKANEELELIKTKQIKAGTIYTLWNRFHEELNFPDLKEFHLKMENESYRKQIFDLIKKSYKEKYNSDGIGAAHLVVDSKTTDIITISVFYQFNVCFDINNTIQFFYL